MRTLTFLACSLLLFTGSVPLSVAQGSQPTGDAAMSIAPTPAASTPAPVQAPPVALGLPKAILGGACLYALHMALILVFMAVFKIENCFVNRSAAAVLVQTLTFFSALFSAGCAASFVSGPKKLAVFFEVLLLACIGLVCFLYKALVKAVKQAFSSFTELLFKAAIPPAIGVVIALLGGLYRWITRKTPAAGALAASKQAQEFALGWPLTKAFLLSLLLFLSTGAGIYMLFPFLDETHNLLEICLVHCLFSSVNLPFYTVLVERLYVLWQFSRRQALLDTAAVQPATA